MSLSLAISFIFILLIFFILWSIVYWSIRNGISPMPTSLKVKKGLFELLPEKVEGDVYELGSGWGTLVFPLAVRYPETHVIGYETSLIPYWISYGFLLAFPKRNLALKRQDFFQVDLKGAHLIVCFLYPGAMEKLKEKFEKELQPGTLIVSNTFAIPGWKPIQIQEVKDLYRTKIYLYRR